MTSLSFEVEQTLYGKVEPNDDGSFSYCEIIGINCAKYNTGIIVIRTLLLDEEKIPYGNFSPNLADEKYRVTTSIRSFKNRKELHQQIASEVKRVEMNWRRFRRLKRSIACGSAGVGGPRTQFSETEFYNMARKVFSPVDYQRVVENLHKNFNKLTSEQINSPTYQQWASWG